MFCGEGGFYTAQNHGLWSRPGHMEMDSDESMDDTPLEPELYSDTSVNEDNSFRNHIR